MFPSYLRQLCQFLHLLPLHVPLSPASTCDYTSCIFVIVSFEFSIRDVEAYSSIYFYVQIIWLCLWLLLPLDSSCDNIFICDSSYFSNHIYSYKFLCYDFFTVFIPYFFMKLILGVRFIMKLAIGFQVWSVHGIEILPLVSAFTKIFASSLILDI